MNYIFFIFSCVDLIIFDNHDNSWNIFFRGILIHDISKYEIFNRYPSCHPVWRSYWEHVSWRDVFYQMDDTVSFISDKELPDIFHLTYAFHTMTKNHRFLFHFERTIERTSKSSFSNRNELKRAQQVHVAYHESSNYLIIRFSKTNTKRLHNFFHWQSNQVRYEKIIRLFWHTQEYHFPLTHRNSLFASSSYPESISWD